MAHILLLASTTGYQTRSFAAAAEHLHVQCTVATDQCHILHDPWGDGAITVRFEDPNIALDNLAPEAQSRGIDAIVAVGDRPTVLAALTAERLQIPWHPPAAALLCRNKRKMRQAFAAASLPTPANAIAMAVDKPATVSPEIGYPCVLKPLGSSGSKGVIRANNAAEFVQAFELIAAILQKPDTQRLDEQSGTTIQMEQFIPGVEYALEGLMTRGDLFPLAIFDKPDPLDGPFFEESIYVTPSRAPRLVQESIVATTQSAVAALGLWHGPVHAEMRVNESGVYMLEIAARPIGGLCARALQFRTERANFSLEELILLHATGQMPATVEPSSPASGVMMIPMPRAGIFESVAGVEAARAVSGIDDVIITLKPGERLLRLPEGAKYPGFIFGSGPEPLFVENALRAAYRELRFDVLSALPLVS